MKKECSLTSGGNSIKIGFLFIFILTFLLVIGGEVATADYGVGGNDCNISIFSNSALLHNIQNAVDVAFKDETLIIEGTCNENVVISKSLNIYGNGAVSTIISAGDISFPILSLTSDNINISNITFTGATSNYGILLSSDFCIISQNVMTDNAYGIKLTDSSIGNILERNEFISNTEYGIYLGDAQNNTIKNNNISGNSKGFGLHFLASGNSLYNNYINNNQNYHFIGSPLGNNWNIALFGQTNIINGPFIGGNYWANPSGTGFSETCADGDGNGICDTLYTINSLNIDYLPLTTPCPDSDGDGYYDTTCGGTDCDDTNSSINPGAAEKCDGVDNNCAGGIDEVCNIEMFCDFDDDGFNSSSATFICNEDTCELVPGIVPGIGFCPPPPPGMTGCIQSPSNLETLGCTISIGDDCDDDNELINPGATEVCDGIDNDCDIDVDEGVKITYYPDLDGDLYGNAASSGQEACSIPPDSVQDNTDCNDNDGSINPAQTETTCDGVDNDCNAGTLDSPDGDGDGFGICEDCNDADSGIYPGNSETTCNGVDDDCEALTLDAPDADIDSYDICGTGDPSNPDGKEADCNDDDGEINPGQAEVTCDDKDNDCDTSTEDKPDGDGDGVTVCDDCDDADANIYPGNSETTCNSKDDDCNAQTLDAPDGDSDGSSVCDDCDDTDANIYPGNTETICNGVDDDCDALTLDAPDGDSDGSDVCSDCDDANPNVYPGNTETTCNGIDDDCDALSLDAPDGDNDGSSVCDDCDDSNANIYPGNTETTCNGVDDDCDALTLDAPDGDGDGSDVCADCDDTNPSIKPGALEVCDGVDNNCLNGVDEFGVCLITDVKIFSPKNVVHTANPIDLNFSVNKNISGAWYYIDDYDNQSADGIFIIDTYHVNVSLPHMPQGPHTLNLHINDTDGMITSYSIDFYVDLFNGTSNIIWSRVYGDSYYDEVNSIKATEDGGSILAGYSRDPISKDYDIILIKQDSDGKIQWRKRIGESVRTENVYSIIELSDGNILIGGYLVNGSDDQSYVVKLDGAGNILWEKTLDFETDDRGYSIIETGDGNYIITGYMYNSSQAAQDFYLVKLDISGNILWTNTYGSESKDYGRSVVQTADDGFLITGYSNGFGNNYQIYTIKTDSVGNKLWEDAFGGIKIDWGESVAESATGEYYVAGWQDLGYPDYNIVLLKYYSNGTIIWNRSYGGSNLEKANSIVATLDGGVIIGGETRSYSSSAQYNPYILKIDGNGDVAWSEVLPGNDESFVFSIDIDTQGRLLIGGYTKEFGYGNKDFYLIAHEEIVIPEVNIYTPQNTTYDYSMIDLNFSVNVDFSWIGYSLNGSANKTTSSNTTLEGLTNGSYCLWLYANDTAGNLASSEVCFTVEGILFNQSTIDTGTDISRNFTDSNLIITFNNVTGAGNVNVSKMRGNPKGEKPSGFKAVGHFYDISTDASFSGNITICVSGFDVQPGHKLFHWEGGRWMDVTTSVNTTDDILCGTVSSLSPFAALDVEPAPPAPSGGGGGGGGGGGDEATAFISKIGANMTDSAKFSESKSPYVSEILITTKKEIFAVGLSLKYPSKQPYGTADIDGKVFKFIEIKKSNTVKDEDIEKAVFKFRVEKKWLDENGIDKSGIALMRFNGGAWNELEVTLLDEDSEYVNFEAISPGFSYFSIVGIEGAVASQSSESSTEKEDESGSNGGSFGFIPMPSGLPELIQCPNEVNFSCTVTEFIFKNEYIRIAGNQKIKFRFDLEDKVESGKVAVSSLGTKGTWKVLANDEEIGVLEEGQEEGVFEIAGISSNLLYISLEGGDNSAEIKLKSVILEPVFREEEQEEEPEPRERTSDSFPFFTILLIGGLAAGAGVYYWKFMMKK